MFYFSFFYYFYVFSHSIYSSFFHLTIVFFPFFLSLSSIVSLSLTVCKNACVKPSLRERTTCIVTWLTDVLNGNNVRGQITGSRTKWRHMLRRHGRWRNSVGRPWQLWTRGLTKLPPYPEDFLVRRLTVKCLANSVVTSQYCKIIFAVTFTAAVCSRSCYRW